MSRELLKDKGWRRHSVVSQRNGGTSILLPFLPNSVQVLLTIENAIAIVSTYDCAVIDSNFEREPWIQFLVALPADLEKSLTSCRDPRRLHFPIYCDTEELNYEVNAAGICQTNRTILLQIDPDTSFEIPQKSKNHLNYWIAERFRQETWPDAFGVALRPIRDRLKRFLNRYNNFASALYIQLNSYEELKNDKYNISLIFAIEEGKERELFSHIRQASKTLANKNLDELKSHLESEIADIFGNSVVFMPDENNHTKKAIEVLSEDAISVFQLKTHFRFSPFALSAQDEAAPVPLDSVPNKTF